jgi:integrase
MGRHRGHNEGTISERTTTHKDGTKTTQYTARLPANAEGVRKSLGTFDNRREAREALKQAQVVQAQGLVVSGKVPTVKEWFDSWLAGRTRIAYSTSRGYLATLRIMATYIGGIRLDRLQESDIATMWEKLASGIGADGTPRKPLAATTLTKYHTHLKAALSAAVRSRHVVLSWNAAAAEEARPARGERKRITPLSEEEVRALFTATRGDDHHPLFVILITTGVRASEAQALRWDDVDWDRPAVSIRAGLHRENGRGLLPGPTKTRKNRLVSLRPEAFAVLKGHRARQREWRLKAGPAWQHTGYVFTDVWGRPLDQTVMSRAFTSACKAARIPRRSLKETRHTFATLALRAGVHPKIVQEALGHASVAMTIDMYSHLVGNISFEAMGHLDRLFGSG